MDNSFKPLPKIIPSLDGIRAISILLVIIGHCVHSLQLSPTLNRFIFGTVGNQKLGVTSFFVISGFLITMLLLREYRKNQSIRLKEFYIRRTLRIFPAYYFYIFCMLVLDRLSYIELPKVDLLASLFYVWNYVHATESWWVGHSWSLSIEEQFYLLWPFTLLLLKPKTALRFAVLIILLSPFIRVATYFLFPEWRGRIPIMLHTRMDSLMFGAAMALSYEAPWFQSLYARLKSFSFHWAALFYLFVISPLGSFYFRGTYVNILDYTLGGAALVYLFTFAIQQESPGAQKLLGSKLMTRIGVLSYSLYLWQQPFLNHEQPSPVFTLNFPLNLVAVFLAAWLSHTLIEKPFLKLKSKWA